MKKTALQEAFSLLEELHPSLFDIHTEKGRTFVNTFHKFLEMEKEQIKDAYLKNHLQGCWMEKSAEEFAEEYYNETFKSE